MEKNWIEHLEEYLESDVGKKHLENYFDEISNKKAISKSQIDRFHNKFNHKFDEIVNKVQTKYNSKEYVDRWYKRSIEPTETLYWFLLDYAMIYGREANLSELEKYGNMFTGEMFYINGYYISTIHGQGSAVLIKKK